MALQLNGSLLALAALTLLLVGCKYFQLPERLESEVTKENPKRPIDDTFVLLNNMGAGRISDIGRPRDPFTLDLSNRPIDAVLAEIVQLREQNGVFLEGTNEIASNVFLFAEPELSMSAFAKLYIAMDGAAGSIYIAKDPDPDPPARPEKPNPLVLHVRTQSSPTTQLAGISYFPWPIHDPEFKYAYNLSSLYIAESAEQLKGTRMFENSLEISADEKYFINEKQGPEADQGPKYSRVKQRPVDTAQIRDELARLQGTDSERIIIISELASYGSLLQAMKSLDGPGISFRIIVRPHRLLSDDAI